jgi:hypothetical protein
MHDHLLHLALGDASAGALRAACEAHGLAGTVHVITDDLSHGPLHDGKARLDYLRSSFAGYEQWRTQSRDAFACWDELGARLQAAASDGAAAGVELAVWAGDNGSEAVLLAMACQRLEGLAREGSDLHAEHAACREAARAVERPDGDAAIGATAMAGCCGPPNGERARSGQSARIVLVHVGLPAHRKRCHVAQFPPAELAALYSQRRRLTARERAGQAAAFRRLRDASRAETGQLRLWQRGGLVAVPADRFDPLVLRACGSEWRPAAGVIGSAMANCEAHNLASDLFLTSRLQRLIDHGRIEALGPRKTLHDYWVRLAAG